MTFSSSSSERFDWRANAFSNRELTLVVPHLDVSSDMKTKMDMMLQSVMKIENACFGVHVKGSEYIPLLGSNDPSSFLVGIPDIEL
ncbi:hypothetical protein GmHk_01G002840 [Glycine max]|nr:hypothetical protein GmHk_01G002840 [Glycine max]